MAGEGARLWLPRCERAARREEARRLAAAAEASCVPAGVPWALCWSQSGRYVGRCTSSRHKEIRTARPAVVGLLLSREFAITEA